MSTLTKDKPVIDVPIELTHGPLTVRENQPAPVPKKVAFPNLAAALAAAQQKCKSAKKEDENTHHHFKYASAENILLEAKQALAGTGLALLPVELTVNGTAKEGENRFELHRKFLLLHESGEHLPVTMHWPICPEKGRPLDKATAIADTTSLAYYLRDLLQMPRVDPEDELAARNDLSSKSQEKKAAAAPKKAEEPKTGAELLKRVDSLDLKAYQEKTIKQVGWFKVRMGVYAHERKWPEEVETWEEYQVKEAYEFLGKLYLEEYAKTHPKKETAA